MSSEEDRNAMLEKIRADMAASRQRLAAMRERKARGSVCSETSPLQQPTMPTAATSTPVTSTIDAKDKFANASSSIMEKLKAERERKKNVAKGVGPALPTSDPTAHLQDTKTNEKIVEQPIPTVEPVKESEKEPEIEKTEVLAAADTVKKVPAPKKKMRKISTLADLQKAIKHADKVKQEAKEQGKAGEERRGKDEIRKKQMTKEERRAYRQSKRLTVELNHSESRVKVDQQIGKFMKMIKILEVEWQKGEEDRVAREKELSEKQEAFSQASSQMEFLSQSLCDISSQMELMHEEIEVLARDAPKNVKKEEKWYGTQLANFETNFQDMRHQAFVSSAKHKKVMKQTQAEAEKLATDAPPTPPEQIAMAKSANPITNLLSQIQKGKSLKKLDPAEVEKQRSERKGNWRQSVQLLQGLQDTLRDALDQRQLDLFSDDEDYDDDEGFYDDWDDDE